MSISRRTFIAGGAAAGAGLIIGMRLPGSLLLAQET
ncbi:MAG: twin-arginine translocation signal domain-containing protein, partial [Candidatus Korobacteraceae bacterium]